VSAGGGGGDGEDEERRRKDQIIGCFVLTDFCRLMPPDPPHNCIRPGSFFGLIGSASIVVLF
jgi:hypothetical protein